MQNKKDVDSPVDASFSRYKFGIINGITVLHTLGKIWFEGHFFFQSTVAVNIQQEYLKIIIQQSRQIILPPMPARSDGILKWSNEDGQSDKPVIPALQSSNEPRHEKTNVLVSDLVRHKPGCTATENG